MSEINPSNSILAGILFFIGLALLLITVVFNLWLIAAVVTSFGFKGLLLIRAYILVVCMMLFLSGFLIIKFRNDTRVHAYLKNALLFLASVLFCLLALEIILRIFVPAPLFSPFFDFWPNKKIQRFFPYYASTNQFGFLGDPVPDDWEKRMTIMTIGGSTTRDVWPAQLQVLLKQVNPSVLVQNAGQDGNATFEHLLMMKTAVPMVKPKMIIFLVGINDMHRQALFRPYEEDDFSYWLISRSRVLQLGYDWLLLAEGRGVWVNRPAYLGDYFIGKGNGILSAYTLKPLSECQPRIDDGVLKKYALNLNFFKNNVVSIINLAKSQNIKTVFLTQPLLFGDSEYWANTEAVQTPVKSACMPAATEWRSMEVFNKTLLDICKDEKVDCFDLANKIPHDQKYFIDSMHYTKAGNALVAKSIFEFIKNNTGVYNFLKNN